MHTIEERLYARIERGRETRFDKCIVKKLKRLRNCVPHDRLNSFFVLDCQKIFFQRFALHSVLIIERMIRSPYYCSFLQSND